MQKNAVYWMLLPFQRYADFQGRSSRAEYWWFTLALLLAGFAIGLLMKVLGIAVELLYVLMLPAIIPSIAVQVRRFHDIGKSGWFILLGLIPFIGSFIIIYFMVQPSMAGPNQYGAHPHDQTAGVFDGTPG
jgi:uncharacterized membrane protein YhaH (DUF805 family)